MFKRLYFMSAAAAVAAPASALAHPVAPSHFVEIAKPYAPYQFLIGDWYSNIPGDGGTIHQQFKWGPGQSYIRYATTIEMAGKPAHLHFEGMMVWNGKAKALDFLFAVEPGSGAEEKGTVRVEADGSVVRDIELTDATGKVQQFRQIFRRTGEDSAVTSLLERTKNGWVPSSPGSDRIEMSRKGG